MASSGYSSDEEGSSPGQFRRRLGDPCHEVDTSFEGDMTPCDMTPCDMPFSYLSFKDYNATQRHYAVTSRSDDDDDFCIEDLSFLDVQMLHSTGETQSAHLVVLPEDERNVAMGTRYFHERIGIGDGGEFPSVEKSSASVFEKKSHQRAKYELTLRPILTPKCYQDRIVCHVNCTKKNFRSFVNYTPKLQPRKYRETCYVLPERSETHYVSSLNYGSAAKGPPRWYTTCVHIEPRTYPNSTRVPLLSDHEYASDLESDNESELQYDDEDELPVGNTTNYKVDINSNRQKVITFSASPLFIQEVDMRAQLNGYLSSDYSDRY